MARNEFQMVDQPEEPTRRLYRLASKVFVGAALLSVTHRGNSDDFTVQFVVPGDADYFDMQTPCRIRVDSKLVYALQRDDMGMRHALASLATEQLSEEIWQRARIAQPEKVKSVEAGQLIEDAMADGEPYRFALDDRVVAARAEERDRAVATVEEQLAMVNRFAWSMRMVWRLEYGKTWGDMLAEEDAPPVFAVETVDREELRRRFR